MPNVEAPVATQVLVHFLEQKREDADFLGRFFNTVSYLEHLGSRKILGCHIDFDNQTLQHAAEETRHALRFKRLALYYCHRLVSYDRDALWHRAAAFGYFQRLDLAVRSFLRERNAVSPRLAYLLVTYLVEKRAEALYPALVPLFEQSKASITLKSIIREEDRHLAEMRAALDDSGMISESDLQHLLTAEDQHFSRFVGALVQL